MSVHNELFATYGSPLIMQNHGDKDSVILETAEGDEIPCSIAALGPIEYTNDTITHEAGNITDRVARRSITLDTTPPLDAVATINDERWSIEDITSSGVLTRVNLILIMASSYGSKQI